MKLRLPLILGIAVLLWCQASNAQELRNWTSSDGTQTIEARIANYESRNRIVTLEMSNGEKIEIPAKRLSSPDRRYLKTYLKSQKADSSNEPEPAKDTANDAQVDQRRNKRNAQSGELYGINWTNDIDAALAEAAGQESPADDRPVMWFRVLGELEGFM